MKKYAVLICWGAMWAIAFFPHLVSGQDEAKLYERECAGCHRLPALTQRNWDANRWQEAINRMHQYGATIPQKDIERLAKYLASTGRGKGQAAVAYIADEDLNEVLVLGVESGKLEKRIAVGKAPHGIATTPDGSRAYVANMGTHDV